MKKLLSMLGIALLMASCTDDYTDWADPITNGAEEPLGVGITASPAAAVDFATYTAEKVQLFTASVTGLDGGKAEYGAEITNEDGSKSIAIEVDENFMADRDELESAIYTLWGRRPIARTIPVNVVGLIEMNKMVIAATASTTFTATPDSPEIADAYYIVGGASGDWAGTAASKALKFSHSDKDVYDDPVFSIVMDAADGDTWFAIGDDKACDAITNDNNWSLLFGTKLGNGKNGTEGSLDRRTKLSDDGSFCVPGGHKKIRVVINMMDYTYQIQSLDFAQFVYFIGATDGWANAEQKLESANFDGVYTGYVYCADPNGWGNEFKFQRVAGSWDDEINSGTFTSGITGDFADGGGNIKATAGEGVYYVTLNLAENTLNAVHISNMNLVGDFNGWNAADDAQQMTWNATDYCFEISGAGVTSNGWKFTANNSWDINLGGNGGGTAIDNLVANGDNITVEGTTIKLYPTRKNSDKIYCTVK